MIVPHPVPLGIDFHITERKLIEIQLISKQLSKLMYFREIFVV